MPIIDDVGHSDYTVPKMEVLSKIFDMHFMITQAVIKKYSSFRRKYALPQKSLWVMGGGERFPALDKFLELSIGLSNGTSMQSEGCAV